MRLSNRLLEELVKEVAGENTVRLVRLIKDKKNVSEFAIADRLRLSVNEVRNMLYKLHAYNLVSFTRKKDKKKGWYIYYWTFDNKRAKEVLTNLKREKLEMLEKRLEREKNSNFFVCPEGCIRLDFESALENEFKCFECGQVLVQEDNIAKIKEIEDEVKIIKDDLMFKREREKKKVKKIKKKIKKQPFVKKKKGFVKKIKKKIKKQPFVKKKKLKRRSK